MKVDADNLLPIVEVVASNPPAGYTEEEWRVHCEEVQSFLEKNRGFVIDEITGLLSKGKRMENYCMRVTKELTKDWKVDAEVANSDSIMAIRYEIYFQINLSNILADLSPEENEELRECIEEDEGEKIVQWSAIKPRKLFTKLETFLRAYCKKSDYPEEEAQKERKEYLVGLMSKYFSEHLGENVRIEYKPYFVKPEVVDEAKAFEPEVSEPETDDEGVDLSVLEKLEAEIPKLGTNLQRIGNLLSGELGQFNLSETKILELEKQLASDLLELQKQLLELEEAKTANVEKIKAELKEIDKNINQYCELTAEVENRIKEADSPLIREVNEPILSVYRDALNKLNKHKEQLEKRLLQAEQGDKEGEVLRQAIAKVEKRQNVLAVYSTLLNVRNDLFAALNSIK